MCSLVEICLEKLQADLEEAQYDDALFSHAVDEALGFHKELTDTFPYPPSLPSTPAILTQAPIFIKWINMERKCTYSILTHYLCLWHLIVRKAFMFNQLHSGFLKIVGGFNKKKI